MNKTYKFTTALFIALGITFTKLTPSIAQEPITIQPVTTFSTPQQAIDTLIPIVLGIGALACFAYILYGGYKYITAGDAPANVSAARQTIINACIGLVLLSLSYAIWVFVLSAVGLGGDSAYDSCRASGAPTDYCNETYGSN